MVFTHQVSLRYQKALIKSSLVEKILRIVFIIVVLPVHVPLIAFHYPHDRFLLGWEYMAQTKEFDYTTIKLYLFIATLTLDI